MGESNHGGGAGGRRVWGGGVAEEGRLEGKEQVVEELSVVLVGSGHPTRTTDSCS